MGEFYIANEYWFAVFQLVTAMLGMGATLRLRDFREVLLEPIPVSVGCLIQLMAVPMLAYAAISLLGVPEGVAIGLALIAAVPGGSSSNMFTHFASGNVALSISITALTTLACLVATPIILGLMISDYLPETFQMPTVQIMREITFNLLLPLALGMYCLSRFPSLAATLARWCIRASMLGLLMIFVGASAAGRLDVDAFGTANMWRVGVFILAMIAIGWLLPRALGIGKADATAIEMEVIVRNINLGLMLKVSLFPTVAGAENELGDTVLFTLLLYGAVQLILGCVLVPVRRWDIRFRGAQ